MAERLSLFTTHRDWLRWEHQPWSTVTDSIESDIEFRAGGATLLTEDGQHVVAIARGGRRGFATTFESRIAFSEISRIEPVAITALVAAVSRPARGAAAAIAAAGYGLFTEVASAAIRAWLSAHSPGASHALEAIIGAEPTWMAAAPDTAAQFRMEQDAVNVALEIAGFDREQALKAEPVPRQASHFLASEEATEPNEDSLVIDDLDVFPGWKRLARLRPGGRLFEERMSGRRLTVLHANKNPIEHTTGVDLVYYVHDYQSFVLVQYKRCVKEGRVLLTRPNPQLDAELMRMEALEKKFRTNSTPGSLVAHRLTDAICFFKLCEADQPIAVSDLCRGKYVDLKTWQLMDSLKLTRGPRAGRRLRYDDVTRYLTNTTFAEVVSEGWVGSVPVASGPLLNYIFERYEAGRSVITASLRLGNTTRRIPTGNQQVSRKSVRP